MLGLGTFAQDYNSAKKAYEKGDISTARTQIDGYVSANVNNPMALFLKAKIYESIASNDAMSASVPDAGLIAFENFLVKTIIN